MPLSLPCISSPSLIPSRLLSSIISSAPHPRQLYACYLPRRRLLGKLRRINGAAFLDDGAHHHGSKTQDGSQQPHGIVVLAAVEPPARQPRGNASPNWCEKNTAPLIVAMFFMPK